MSSWISIFQLLKEKTSTYILLTVVFESEVRYVLEFTIWRSFVKERQLVIVEAARIKQQQQQGSVVCSDAFKSRSSFSVQPDPIQRCHPFTEWFM